MVQYSIHRALAKVKIYNNQIRDKIAKATFVDYYSGENGTVHGISQQKAMDNIKNEYASIKKLISNYEDLKGAIVKSNAGITSESTNIKTYDDVVEGKALTMAQILDFYNNCLPIRKIFLDTLKAQFHKTKNTVDSNNIMVDNRLDKQLASFNGNDNDKNSNGLDLGTISDVYHKKNDCYLLDPLDLNTMITQYDKEYTELYEKIDSVISENNALATIDVDF